MEFDATITLGHVLQGFTFLAALAVLAHRFDKRLALVEHWILQSEGLESEINELKTRVSLLEAQLTNQGRAHGGAVHR